VEGSERKEDGKYGEEKGGEEKDGMRVLLYFGRGNEGRHRKVEKKGEEEGEVICQTNVKLLPAPMVCSSD